MDNPTQALYRRLLDLRQRLLQRYEPEDLHQLRVSLRRLRSWLKDLPSIKARKLNRAMAELIKPSNAARDWDTLAIRAQQQLSAELWQAFQQRLEPILSHYHQQALEPLLNHNWQQLEQRWTAFDQSSPATEHQHHAQSLDRARHRFIKAKNSALSQPSDRRWHRLRIRTKNLRYQLEGQDNLPPHQQHWVSQLKALQQHLGDWHDAQVHQQLLTQLSQRQKTESEGHSGAISQLQQHCRQQAQSQLAQAEQQIRLLNGL